MRNRLAEHGARRFSDEELPELIIAVACELAVNAGEAHLRYRQEQASESIEQRDSAPGDKDMQATRAARRALADIARYLLDLTRQRDGETYEYLKSKLDALGTNAKRRGAPARADAECALEIVEILVVAGLPVTQACKHSTNIINDCWMHIDSDAYRVKQRKNADAKSQPKRSPMLSDDVLRGKYYARHPKGKA
jgi:hypothetical protein